MMEERLRQLIATNGEDARAKLALECKGSGRKIIGRLDNGVPEELICASGMLPWRVTGTWGTVVEQALAYRPVNSDVYYTRVLESQLLGELDFLDAIIATNREDDQRRLYDVLARVRPTYIMFVPCTTTESALVEWERSLVTLATTLEEIGGQRMTTESLRAAIIACNKKRCLIRQVYELRKREHPPLSGAEFLGLTTAATVMPVDRFNAELESLLPYLDERKTLLPALRPRLLVSSDVLDHPGYIQLIEELGALVAMDDLDTGSRFFWQTVDETAENLYAALVIRDATRPQDPRMASWDGQAQQVVDWAREFAIDGVVELVQIYNYPREFRIPLLREKLVQAGIPNISIRREYHLANVGQLQTRVGAFLEMLVDD